MAKVKKLVVLKNCNYEAQSYCFNKGFEIYPELSAGKFKIAYSRGGHKQYYMKGQLFNLQEAFQSIWDLYTKIYNYEKQK